MEGSNAPLPDELDAALVNLLDQPTAGFWPGVEALCDKHPRWASRLRAEAQRLQRQKGGDFTVPIPAAAAAAAPRPTEIGPYRILEYIGHGGMGEVYKAEQRSPARRLVAIKVIKQGMATKEVLARFRLEQKALASMSHSTIAKVFDAGATERGDPYFVMEFVEGIPFTHYCDKHKLALPERIALFQQVCAGVQHAHQKGFVHRDLKPGNVLVAREGDAAVAKILDFGLAKAMNRDVIDFSFHSESDRVMGTYEYMAPEQAAGDGEAIDARTDIYALGVLLYELLSGELPFPDLRQDKDATKLKRIQEEEPGKPSARLSSNQQSTSEVAARRRTSLTALRKALAGDLDWVVLKAMAKEPERRYESAAALAADLSRYLAHEPVLAGPPTLGYQLRKFARRYRAQLAAVAMVLVALVLALAVSITFWRDARTQAEEAERQKQIAQEQAKAAEAARVGEAAKAKEAAENAAKAQRSAAEALASKRLFELFSVPARLKHLEQALDDLGPPWQDTTAARRWLDDADLVLALRPQLRETVAELRGQAVSGPAADGQRDTYRFASEAQALLHSELSDGLAKLDTFETRERSALVQRLRCADLTTSHPRAPATWQQAAEAIAKADGLVASALYKARPIDLRPHLGLVPIGMNPATKLWEFYHLRSAWDPAKVADPAELAIPAHDAEGRIEVGDDTGIVFVLLPGGTFMMGAQSKDKAGANYDPMAQPEEGPPHRVTLSPFFLARHELTEGQWLRLGGGVIGSVAEGVAETYPIKAVSWFSSQAALRAQGLTLPTEAQWEYGCRGGTTTPWWTGGEESSLGDELGGGPGRSVGRRRSNAFGLHDLAGGVSEWCLDTSDTMVPDTSQSTWRDDVADPCEVGGSLRVIRGGRWLSWARFCRSAYRFADEPGIVYGDLGFRPALAARSDVK